jgi:hypothetical protein
MFIFDLNKKDDAFKCQFLFKETEFTIHSLSYDPSPIKQSCYVIGYVESLHAHGCVLEHKNVAGSFVDVEAISGTGFYITSRSDCEFTRFAEPNIHAEGALKYIDGCSNTELISPVKVGLPTVNYLHVPSNTTQTSHIHKSARVGWIAKGNGYAVTDTDRHVLSENIMFFLPAYENHYFETKQDSLSIIVFHPDSDIGPTDENNNMKVRTHI